MAETMATGARVTADEALKQIIESSNDFDRIFVYMPMALHKLISQMFDHDEVVQRHPQRRLSNTYCSWRARVCNVKMKTGELRIRYIRERRPPWFGINPRWFGINSHASFNAEMLKTASEIIELIEEGPRLVDFLFDLKSEHEYIKQANVLMRRKDFLHLILFYPMKTEAEVNFGSLLDKFSTLNKYIRTSRDSSTDANYLMNLETLLEDIQEHLDAADFDVGAYLPKGLVNKSENLATETNYELVVPSASGSKFVEATLNMDESFWSDKQEIHTSAINSASLRALKCIKDLKVKKLGVSGSGAEEVAETLKDLPELRRAFDMVLCVRFKHHHGMRECISIIKEEIHLWKKRSSETGKQTNVLSQRLHCLLFIDSSDSSIDLHKIELNLSEQLRSLQIVLTCRLQNVYHRVDLEIRTQDHLLPWILFSKNVDLETVGQYPGIQQLAVCLVKGCDGHLLAIILLARALQGVIDVGVWELALQALESQQEPTSSHLGGTNNVMVRVLRFIWSRMQTMAQKCIIQCALYYNVAEFLDSSLIKKWIMDGFVKNYGEGQHVIKDLLHSYLLEQVGYRSFRLRDETRVVLVTHFVPRAHGLYLKQDGSESNQIPTVEEWDAREIHLTNNVLSQLPDTPNCPILVNLFLHTNQDLMDIPITFFDHMPSLQVLDLSSTSIKCLPCSISKLTALQQLFIRDCDLLMELPPNIGFLRNLRVFDSEGTQLLCLPNEFGLLTKLECLKFSLYNSADRYKQIIPAIDLSKLIRLKELSICANSYGKWWKDEVELIIDILPKVRNLESLKLYFPTTELLHIFMEKNNWEGVPIYPHLSNFGFIVGCLQQRLISRIPLNLQEMFVKLPKCLKYTNGEGDTKVIAKALKHANALFLDRHWTIQSLCAFEVAEMEKLKFCLLAECNEMLQIVDGSDFYKGGNEDEITPVLGSLQYLAIYYMKSLSCIWKGPIHSWFMCNLKTLTIHACPELTTILTPELHGSLTSLEYLSVQDCTKISSLVSQGPYHPTSTLILPSLKKMSLLHLRELVSISGGASIAPRLESLVIYDCPNLEKLSYVEISVDIGEIKGENEWWDALRWCEPKWTSGQPDYLASVFIPLGRDGDIMDELADAVNFLPHLSD